MNASRILGMSFWTTPYGSSVNDARRRLDNAVDVLRSVEDQKDERGENVPRTAQTTSLFPLTQIPTVLRTLFPNRSLYTAPRNLTGTQSPSLSSNSTTSPLPGSTTARFSFAISAAEADWKMDGTGTRETSVVAFSASAVEVLLSAVGMGIAARDGMGSGGAAVGDSSVAERLSKRVFRVGWKTFSFRTGAMGRGEDSVDLTSPAAPVVVVPVVVVLAAITAHQQISRESSK